MKRKILISQIYYTKKLHNFLIENHEKVEELFIDSGGFSWFQKSFKESEEKYFLKYMSKVEKIRELQKYFKVRFIQLDKPLHEEETKVLWEKQKNIADFCPVFTIGSNLSYLEKLAKENSFIFLGGTMNRSNEWLYNYLEPSFSFEKKFSEVLAPYKTKIHILGKSSFDYNLEYFYSMDSCIFNGATLKPKLNKIRNYYKENEKYKHIGNANFFSYSFCYLEKLKFLNLPKFVFALAGLQQLKICLKALNELEQEAFDEMEILHALNKIPQKAQVKKDTDLQQELF